MRSRLLWPVMAKNETFNLGVVGSIPTGLTNPSRLVLLPCRVVGRAGVYFVSAARQFTRGSCRRAPEHKLRIGGIGTAMQQR